MISRLFFKFIAILSFIVPAFLANSQSANVIKVTESQIREQMLQLTKELGVSCAECHDTKNFKSDALPNHRIAKEHMRWVDLLRDNGMNGRNAPEASCYMCHKGQLKFQFDLKDNHK